MSNFESWAKGQNLTQADLGELIGLSPSYVSLIFRGKRKVSPKKARHIEQLTKGEVRACDLRPDIFSDLGSETAPP